ncbi:unnamed protein product [Leptosia nina]|uniref:THAP-type domain-containing protein n=1 Tax=Leptosia nina TaxID=320188 RepID=A0AAV1J5S8_9NEOP
MRVCSRHFKASNYFPNNSKRQKLFPNVVPSQNIPKRIFNKKGPVVRKIKSIAQGTQSLSVTKQGNIVTSNRKVKKVMDGLSCDDITDTNSHHDLKTSSTQVNLVDYRHYRPQADWSMADLLCERVPLEKCTQINFLPLWKEEIAAPTQLTFSDLLNSVKDLFYLTDIHSIELLEALVNYVRESAVNTSTDEKFLSLRETLIVTMNKLKQNISI